MGLGWYTGVPGVCFSLYRDRVVFGPVITLEMKSGMHLLPCVKFTLLMLPTAHLEVKLRATTRISSFVDAVGGGSATSSHH